MGAPNSPLFQEVRLAGSSCEQCTWNFILYVLSDPLRAVEGINYFKGNGGSLSPTKGGGNSVDLENSPKPRSDFAQASPWL